MNRMFEAKSMRYFLWLVVIILVLAISGCSQPAPESPTQAIAYAGALDTTYADALDPISQLALGTLQLADTPDAVMDEQTPLLRSLWQSLQGTALKSDAERYAVLRQIELTLSEAQLSAIRAMHLTDTDALTWLDAKGYAANAGGNQGSPGFHRDSGGNTDLTEEQRAVLREQFANMSAEERAAQGTRFANGGAANGTAGGVSARLLRAVIALLRNNSAPTQDVSPVSEARAAPATPLPTLPPTVTPSVTVETEESQDITPTPSPTPQGVETAEAESMSDVPVVSVEKSQPQPVSGPETLVPVAAPSSLVQIQDTDPGPPFSVEVTTNLAVPNPDLEGGWIYIVGGFVRNDSDQTYSLSAINVTFYDADGFRGAFYPFSSSGGCRVRGGEWIWHGRTTAEYACLILAPGQTCPFSVQITALDMGSFLIHPDAAVVQWHEATTAEVRDVKLVDDNSGYLRISGLVHNSHAYKIKNVMVTGMLRDAAGQMVSFGTVTLLDENIEPGGDVHFELRVGKTDYVDYALSVAAEGDFD